MKAVIVDIKGNNAIVLSKNGQFMKVNYKKEMKIGSEIDLQENRIARPYGPAMRALAAAAVFIFTIGIGYGAYSYYTPYSYVNVDINPSVEIVANRYDRILKVEAINDDGAKVLENQQFKNHKVGAAVEEIIKKASEKGYIKEGTSNAVMLTVSSKEEKKSVTVEKAVQEAAQSEIQSSGVKAEVLAERVTLEQHDEARKLDMSPGKLALIGKLQDLQPKTTIEEYKDAPVKEILKAIDTQKKEERKEDKEEKEEKKEQKTENKEAPKESLAPKKEPGSPAKESSEADEKDKGRETVKSDKKSENKDDSAKKNASEQNGKGNAKTPQEPSGKDKKDKSEGTNWKINGNKK